MPHILCVSPHLDDGAFSVGGLLASLARLGWRVTLATVFTRSMPGVAGFALACQLDKGIGPEVDYMALRRAEDAEAAAQLGVHPVWLDLPEAPHRGYRSASALFGTARDADEIWRDVAERLSDQIARDPADWLLAPQALGRHIDHRQVVRAVLSLGHPCVGWYRDLPYAIRAPEEQPEFPAAAAMPELAWPIEGALPQKIAATQAYRSQLGFQFRGADRAGVILRRFAEQEGARHKTSAAEVLRGSAPAADIQ